MLSFEENVGLISEVELVVDDQSKLLIANKVISGNENALKNDSTVPIKYGENTIINRTFFLFFLYRCSETFDVYIHVNFLLLGSFCLYITHT